MQEEDALYPFDEKPACMRLRKLCLHFFLSKVEESQFFSGISIQSMSLLDSHSWLQNAQNASECLEELHPKWQHFPSLPVLFSDREESTQRVWASHFSPSLQHTFVTYFLFCIMTLQTHCEVNTEINTEINNSSRKEMHSQTQGAYRDQRCKK